MKLNSLKRAHNTSEKVMLSGKSWVERYPGWLHSPKTVMKTILSSEEPRTEDCIILRWYGLGFSEDSNYQDAQDYGWSDAILPIKHELEAKLGKTYNSCQANYYMSGQEGVGWHTDNNQLVEIDEDIASISMGSSRKMVFRKKPKDSPTPLNMAYQSATSTQAEKSITINSGDLVVMKGKCQEEFEHAVLAAASKQPRLTLIFRFYGRRKTANPLVR